MNLSVVIPVYNEKGNLEPLAKQVREAVSPLGISYECVWVDDGSTDGSAEELNRLLRLYPQMRVIRLKRNFGQTAALAAGFDHSEGDIIVTLDADGQNDPADIPVLLKRIDEGHDLVSGWRRERHDGWARSLASHIANSLISWVTGVRLKDYGCTLKAYRRSTIKHLKLYGEMHRFIPALASWSGVSMIEIPVRHHPRKLGKSKYGFSRIIRVLFDLVTVKFLLSYSTSPIQIFGKVALLSSFLGVFFLAGALYLKFARGHFLSNHPFFMLFVLLEMIGIQCVLIGLVAEMIVRTYHESQDKKIYNLKEKLPV